jgi:hypothetical protein
MRKIYKTPYTSLPLGSVRARGWLLKQLEFQKDGATGYSEEIYTSLGPESTWHGGADLTQDPQDASYYVKGLVALAYILNDESLIKKAEKWMNSVINSQKEDGSFGPANCDWWLRIPMLYALKDFQEATGDARVVPFMSKYFQYQLAGLPSNPLVDWSKARAGDNIELIYWLYEKTEESFLLELVELLKSQSYDWTDIHTGNKFTHFGDDLHTKHCVNVAQAMKTPAIYYQQSQADRDRDAFMIAHEHLMRDHGQPVGIHSGNEFISGISSIAGIELCSVVERMQSNETAMQILGLAELGDQLEKITFNALPGVMGKTIKEHQYYMQVNQVQSKYGDYGFDQNYDQALLPSPFSGMGCCRYNMHIGWPYYVKHMWASTKEDGLALMAYGPSEVTAKVSGGTAVTIVEDTAYPFEETVRLTLKTNGNIKFPLKLRIPGWCEKPVIKVNGDLQVGVVSGEFYTLERIWNNQDLVTLDFPMTIKTADQLNNSLSIERGPLVYSLQIEENWSVRTAFTPEGFNEHEVFPMTAWNYGLILDRGKPEDSIKFVQGEPTDNPFSNSLTPVKLIANARKIPSWGLAWNGLYAFDPPISPIESAEKTEQITLIPFGAATLRVTDFPEIGIPRRANTSYRDNFATGHADGWVNYGGSWAVLEGELCAASNWGSWGSGIRGVKSVATATNFTDFTYTANITLGTAENAGLIFRVSNPSIGVDAYNGYYVGLDTANQRIVLGKSEGYWRELASKSMKIVPNHDFNGYYVNPDAVNPDSGRVLSFTKVEIVPNQMYHIKIIAQGSRIQVFLADVDRPQIDMMDNTFTKGSIGVRSYSSSQKGTQAKFGSLLVLAL